MPVGQSLILSELGSPHPLYSVLLSPPQGGGDSLAVRGQLQVIRPHFEEVQQVWAAGDLHGQSHEGVEVLCERALAALGSTLPIKPFGCWVGAPETHEYIRKVKSKCIWEGVSGSRRGALGRGTLLRGSVLLTREVWDDPVLPVDLASLDGEHLLQHFLDRGRNPELGLRGRVLTKHA